MKRNLQLTLTAIIIFLSSVFVAKAQVASSPPYTLEQSVISSGGGTSSSISSNGSNTFSITGTIGQSIAGTNSVNSPFSVFGGFWRAFSLFAPTADNQSVSTSEDNSRTITLTASDPNNSSLTYTIVSNPMHGTLSGSGANWTYTPFADYFGTDSFSFKVSNGSQESTPGTITINITEVNDAPIAAGDNKTTAKNTALTFPASDLTQNDNAGAANESAQALTVSQVTATSNTYGQVSLNNGQITYQPNTDYTGTASFVYQVCDNGTTNGVSDAKCSQASVTINVIQSQPTINFYEADVAPRPNGNGDGFVNGGDITQIRLFVAGLQTPDSTASSTEFQRADSAPLYANNIMVKGDGLINSGDITQARRYAANLDTTQTADGPTAPVPAANINTDVEQTDDVFNPDKQSTDVSTDVDNTDLQTTAYNKVAATRDVRAVMTTRVGNVITVGVNLNTATGDAGANTIGFTLLFDQTVLSNPTNIRLGSAGSGAFITANDFQVTMGRVGVVLDLPVNPMTTFPVGDAQLVLIDFTVAANAPSTTALSFGSTIVQNFVGDIAGNQLPATFSSSIITLTSPTAADASISGRVIGANGKGLPKARVSITATTGESRTTLTNRSGHFRFDQLAPGTNYIIEVKHRRYTFAPQIITLTEDLDGLIFTAIE